MGVTFALFGPLRDAAGRKLLEFDVETPAPLGDVFEQLVETESDLREHLDSIEDSDAIAITVDGTNIRHLDGFETRIDDGQVVRITPPIVGGNA